MLDTEPVVARMKSDLVTAWAKRFVGAKQYYQAVMPPETADAKPAAEPRPPAAR